MQETSLLKKNVGFQRLLKDKFPSRRGVTIGDVEKISGGWETELYSFAMEYEEQGKRHRQEMIVRIFPSTDAERKSRREFTAMKNLHGVGFPVPEVYLLEAGGSVLGRPFIVMERVLGRVMTDLFIKSSVERREKLLTLFCELFICLHSIDLRRVFPDGVSINLGDPYSFVDRKLGAMQRVIERFQRTELSPVLHWLQARRDTVPCERNSVLHLDYHPDNIIVRENGSAAVIDWGSCVIGDPRSDLAWTLMLTSTYMDSAMRDAIITTYEGLSAKRIRNIEYFEVLAVLRRLLDLTISLTGSATDRGMRQGVVEQMKMASGHYRKVLEYLHERTGLRILEIERMIESFPERNDERINAT